MPWLRADSTPEAWVVLNLRIVRRPVLCRGRFVNDCRCAAQLDTSPQEVMLMKGAIMSAEEVLLCRSGRKPIPGLVYSQKAPGIAQRQRWIADVEAAVTCPELAVALRHFDAAVLWDSVRRPAEEGRWAGVHFLGRRAGLMPGSWQYLVTGGPADLPQVCCVLL